MSIKRKHNKRICMVLQEYFPEDIRVKKYVHTLKREGYYVDIISLKRRNLKFKERHSNGIIYRIGIPKKRATLLRYFFEYLLFFVASFLLLNLLFLKKRYTIIHVHNMPDFLIFVTFFPKAFGAKVILDMHEITPEFFQIKYSVDENSFLVRLCIFLEFFSVRFADCVITVTDRIKEKFIERNNVRYVEVIMNTGYSTPVDDIRVNNSDNNYFEMIYHGTLTDLYSLDLPIKALSSIDMQKNKVRFNIYGEGPVQKQLEILVKRLNLQDTVLFRGLIPHNEMIEIVRKMNLGVLTIRRNQFTDLSFSNKLSEYVDNCIPVLTTKLSSVLDYFDEDDLSLCEDNVESIRVELLDIIHRKLNLKEKVLSAKRKYEDIAWDKMEQKYLNIIKSL